MPSLLGDGDDDDDDDEPTELSTLSKASSSMPALSSPALAAMMECCRASMDCFDGSRSDTGVEHADEEAKEGERVEWEGWTPATPPEINEEAKTETEVGETSVGVTRVPRKESSLGSWGSEELEVVV